MSNNSTNNNPGGDITPVPLLGNANFQRVKHSSSRHDSNADGDQKTSPCGANSFNLSQANFPEASPKRQVYSNSHSNNVPMENQGDIERPWFEHRQQQQLVDQPDQQSSSMKRYSLAANDNCSQPNTSSNSSFKKTVYTAADGFETNDNLSSATRLSPTMINGCRGILLNQQEQDFSKVVVTSNGFNTDTATETHLRQLSQNLRDNVPTSEVLCDLPISSLSTAVKLEPAFNKQTTSQNRVADREANETVTVITRDLPDITDVVSVQMKQVDSQSIGDNHLDLADVNYVSKSVPIGPVSQLEELYQFEQEYFFQAGDFTTEKSSATGSTSDIGCHNNEPRSNSRTNDNPALRQETEINQLNGVDRNSTTNEQTSVVAKQSTNGVNNDNHNIIRTNDNSDSLLKQLNCNDDSFRCLSNEARPDETCQGYGSNQHETDDRLKQLSLRFSADANKKPRAAPLIDNNDGASLNNTTANRSATQRLVSTSTDQSEGQIRVSGSGDDEIRKIDIYSFDLDTTMLKGNDEVKGETAKRYSRERSISPCAAFEMNPIEGDGLGQQADGGELSVRLNEGELNDIIERISSAHRDTCSFLKTKTIDICKRQSISSLPNIAGLQYCRYRQTPPIAGNKQRSDNSPTSSLLNGSAGSSASSVSSASSSGGGSPMNNSQYITSSPTLSPTPNTSNTNTAPGTARNSRMTSYLDVSNHHHDRQQQQQQQHMAAPLNGRDLKLASDTAGGKQAQSSNELSNSSLMTIQTIEEYKITLWQEYALLINPSIQQVVEFAKQVPGFLALNQLDQLLLIKSGFFEIWLVTIAGMFNCSDNTLTFSDGTYIDRQQLDTMFDKNFTTIAFNFSISFNQLCLDDTEIGLVSAIILLQPSK